VDKVAHFDFPLIGKKALGLFCTHNGGSRRLVNRGGGIFDDWRRGFGLAVMAAAEMVAAAARMLST
jgi:hypothetical protein